ncbi:MAG: NAD(P)H-binding protein [Myxococcota bacterium]
MRVVLAGGTGTIGRAVARELVSQGHEVVALVRGEPRGEVARDLEGCALRRAELTDRESTQAALAGDRADALVSCIASRNGVPADAWAVDHGANQNLLGAAEGLGAERFVLLSAICVQKPELAFQHAKLAFEAELGQHGIGYAIVRPTAFFKSLSGQIERVRQGKAFLVFGEGTEIACKPISDGDLARYVVQQLPRPESAVLPIGGPGPALTPRDQGALLFELTGREPRYKRVPLGIFDAAIGVLSPLGRLVPSLRAKAELARIGRYYATESMLVWDAENERFDADATPETGSDTLRDHYARVLRDDLPDERGAHALFK